MNKIEKIALDIIKHGGIGIILVTTLYLLSGFSTGNVLGNSMNPYFKNRDSYSRIKRGLVYNRCDTITFDAGNYNTDKEDVDFIKRIIGLPNEIITISNSKIYINDKVIDETGFLNVSASKNDNHSLVLGKNEYFVLGDNRLHSSDSRYFGPVHKKDLSKVISKQGKSECLSAYESSGVASVINIKKILIFSIVLLTTLIVIIFISLYNPEFVKKLFKFKYIVVVLKILVSTTILWFSLLLTLSVIVRLLWFLKLTPVQTNSGNVKEIIEDRETEFKKFDKWL